MPPARTPEISAWPSSVALGITALLPSDAGEVAQPLRSFEPDVILSEAKDLMAIANGVLV